MLLIRFHEVNRQSIYKHTVIAATGVSIQKLEIRIYLVVLKDEHEEFSCEMFDIFLYTYDLSKRSKIWSLIRRDDQ